MNDLTNPSSLLNPLNMASPLSPLNPIHYQDTKSTTQMQSAHINSIDMFPLELGVCIGLIIGLAVGVAYLITRK